MCRNMNATILRKIPAYMRRFPQVKNLTLKRSPREGKRLVANFTMFGQHHTVHFGQWGAFTYADGATKEKRDSYRARASKITNKNGQYTFVIPGTPNSFAYWILW